MDKRKRLALAVGMGVATFVGLYFYLRALQIEAQGGERVAVVVAGRDLARGTRLRGEDLRVRMVPAQYAHPEGIRQIEAGQVVGRPIEVTRASGSPLLWSDMARDGDVVRDLSGVIRAGKRALTIPVDAATAMGGMIRPGDRVDILGTFTRAGEGTAERETKTVLQVVPVLAVGNRLGVDPGDQRNTYSTITVEVSLEEAELLSFLTGRGKLHVVLRNKDDATVAQNLRRVDVEAWLQDQAGATTTATVEAAP